MAAQNAGFTALETVTLQAREDPAGHTCAPQHCVQQAQRLLSAWPPGAWPAGCCRAPLAAACFERARAARCCMPALLAVPPAASAQLGAACACTWPAAAALCAPAFSANSQGGANAHTLPAMHGMMMPGWACT